uniref:Sodium/potassium-transporting ATPase subunit beta-3 n=1 Tax=Monopterus albus TaxID=43700 RepID=A0A3Q3K7E4_MONAL
MWVMLQTLDENVPRHQDRVANPGLVVRPYGTEISFNRSGLTNYSGYIRVERNALYSVDQYTEEGNELTKKVCQFKRSNLHQCSGLADTSFGYAEGKPCIIIKMNRVIGLKPRGEPYINCIAKVHTHLCSHCIDIMHFFYRNHLSLFLQPDYVQPLIAVKLFLTKEDYNVEQTVECKLEGSNLQNNDDRDKFQGRVIFRVKVLE